jgi:dsRNA-specific ribonuclease
MTLQGGRMIDSILGDAVEALIAAVWDDSQRDFKTTAKIVFKLFEPCINELFQP